MRFISLLILLSTITLLAAEEQVANNWQPHQHPAFITRSLTGYTEAIHSMDLAAEVSARIVSIPVDVGDTIADKQFIQLDDSLANIDVSLAQAQFDQAQAQLKIHEANVKLAHSEEVYRKSELERINKLIEQNVASDEQFDAVNFQHKQAVLATLQQNANLEQAKQLLAVNKAQLLRAQTWLHRYRIELPADWSVSKRFVHPQSLAQPGISMLRLNDLRTLIIRYQLDEIEIESLRHSETLSVSVGEAQKEIPVSIKSVNPEFDPQSRKRSVSLQAKGVLFPEASGGITCKLHIRIKDPNNGLLIPQRYIQKRFDQNRVQLSNGDWLPVIIMRNEGEYAVIQAKQLPDNCSLRIPQ